MGYGPAVSSGTTRMGRGALLGLAAVGLITTACGGGSAGKTASSSTTSSTRGSSTTAGPSPGTPTTAKAGTTSTSASAGVASATSTTGGGGSAPTTTARPATVRVDSTQNGRTVVLHVGDTLQVVLTGCGGCGYTWRMTGQPSPVVFTYQGEQTATPSTTSTSAGQPPVVGQPVTYVWTFKAVSAHTTGFIAQYFPPGQSTRASQTFAVQLRVSA